MTEAENKLIEAALRWRRVEGPARPMTNWTIAAIATCAEAVIRERNRAAQADSGLTMAEIVEANVHEFALDDQNDVLIVHRRKN